MLNVVCFRRYIRPVWRVAIYLDGVLAMSNYYEFLKAPEDEISVSWPGETKSYKPSDIKSLESEIARLKRAVTKLETLILLTDPSVSNVEMNEVAGRQWTEYMEFCKARAILEGESFMGIKIEVDPTMGTNEWRLKK